MLNTKKAFTLVELIVVITILAILGTIAFISLQGYSADARNSKRTQDLNNLAGSINIKTTQGASLISFVSDSLNKLTGIQIAGTGTLSATQYNAGEANYTALDIKASDFKDPKGNYYPIGVTSKKDGQFEIAAKMENGNGSPTAKINGTYKARTTTAETTATGSITSGSKILTITDADIGKFFKGDEINVGGTTNNTITKVSVKNITLTNAPTLTSSATGVTLSLTESGGLIGNATALTIPITNDSLNVPY